MWRAKDLVFSTSVATSDISGSKLNLSSMTGEVQRNVLKELLEEIEVLKRTIETLSNRKSKCEALVRDLRAPPSDATSTQPGQANAADDSDDAEDSKDAEESENNEGNNDSARDDFSDKDVLELI